MTSRPRAGVVLALIATASLVLAAQTPATPPTQGRAQQPSPTFRSGVETVAIYATALDRYGEMVLNLTQSDFDVYDEGKKQELTVFVGGLQPITAVLLIDTSASMTLSLELAQAAAEQFVIRMLPGDRARIASFSDRIDLLGEFSPDRDVLLRTLRAGLHIGNPTLLWDAVDETMSTLTPFGGRRVIMLFTDGIDTLSKKRLIDIVERARAEELMVYAVQFRTNMLARMAEIPISPGPSAMLSDDRSRNPPPGEGLRRITSQTGGGQFVLGEYDDINTTFTRVMQELHYQYVLGFAPQKADGRIHTLDIRVRKPGVFVRARQSYLAPKPTGGSEGR